MYEIQILEGQYDLKDPEAKTEFYNAVARKLSEFTEPVERNNYIQAICDKYFIEYDSFKKLVNDFGEKYLVSPACNIFSIVDHSVNPYYFLYVLKRSEFQRKCVFLGDGNTRGGINVNDFSSMSIPVPASDKQSIISNLYRSFENRRKLNEKLKAQIKDICPILIKASIEEARKEA